MPYVIETQHLSHQFSANEPILRNINIRVEAGSIYGFLGPNGAGKTTSLRLILGLLKRQQGEVSIFGLPFDQHRESILGRVGTMIESPSLYSHLTARENLEVWRKLFECPRSRIDHVLDLVGLKGTGSKSAGRFSLGMRQRLGIAVALLHEPELLVLDEPTNGLDPNGMIEIRELLRTLNGEHGVTILISSHLLAEIEKMVSHVGVIHKGTMMFQGTLTELIEKQHETSCIELETDNIAASIRIAKSADLQAHEGDGRITVPIMPKEKVALLIQQLVQNGIHVYEVRTIKSDLEAIFMELINN